MSEEQFKMFNQILEAFTEFERGFRELVEQIEEE